MSDDLNCVGVGDPRADIGGGSGMAAGDVKG